MIKLSLGIILFSQLNVGLAQDCLEGICVGNMVLTSSDSVGRVIAIKNNKIIYKSGTWDNEATPNELSVEVNEKNGLKKSIAGLTKSDSVGKILNVFANGKANMQVGSFDNVYDGVSPEIDELKSGLKKGIKGLTTSDSVGTVLNVFANGKANMQVGSFDNVYDGVSPEVSELKNGLKKGKMGLTTTDSVGKVLNVFANGKANMQVGSFDNVYDGVSPEIDELKSGLKKGIKGLTTTDSVGTVLNVFANGKANMQVGSFDNVYSNVSPEVPVLKNGLKNGIKGLTSSDSVGTVLNVFANGKANMKVGSFDNVYSDVSPEVMKHPKYNKTDLYANSHTIGKAISFFANEKIEFLDQFNNFTSVVTELFSKVDSLREFKAGSIVLNPFQREGSVQNIFSNGVLSYKAKVMNRQTKKEEVKEFSSRIFENSNQDIEVWFQTILNYLRVQELNQRSQLYYSADSSNLVELKENYKTTVSELLATLQASDDYISNINDKAKVEKYLKDILAK
jgi:hypothetical protein